MNTLFFARHAWLVCLVSTLLLAPAVGCRKERSPAAPSSPTAQAAQLSVIKSQALSPSDSPQTVACEGQIRVTVPGELLRSPATLTISAVANPPQPPGPDIRVLAAYDVSLGDVRQLPGELEIELPVPADALRTDCPPEASLCAGYFDAAAQGWVELPTTLSSDRKSMKVRTSHLCILETWYITPKYTFLPGRDFGVFYHKDAVTKASIDYKARFPATNPAIPGYVSDIYEFARQARDAYAKHDLKPYAQPLWILVMPDSSNPAYTWHLQRLFMTCGSSKPDVLQYAVAHEMFHAIQHAGYSRRQATRLDHKWWLEATAEYASSRLAMSKYRYMGKLDEQVMPPRMLLVQLHFSGSLESDAAIAGAQYHQYQMGHFLEFICRQMRPGDPQGFFVEMYKNVVRRTIEGEGWIESAPSAVDSLDAFLTACNKDTSLDDMFRKFALFYLLSSDSPMNMTGAPPGQVNPKATSGTFTLKATQKATEPLSFMMSGRHTADMMIVTAEMRQGQSSREVVVELAEHELPPRTALFVCKLPGKERARMETLGVFATPQQAKDSISVTLGADDQISLVAVNDHPQVHTIRAVVKSATSTILGVYEGTLSLTHMNKEEYANIGMLPGTDASTLNMNKNRKAGNEARLTLLENAFAQKAAGKVKLQIVFNSDAQARAKSGAKPDTIVAVDNGLVANAVVGGSGHVSSQDTKRTARHAITGNTLELVSSEQIVEAGDTATYVYTIKASVSGNRLTGQWVTTRNGKVLFKGTLTADRIALVGEDGSVKRVD